MSASKRKKIGLALGGGGALGLAHIGVIKEFERAGIPIDFIAGTSMGAIIGGWYAASKDILYLENLFLKLKFRDIFPLREFVRHKDGALASGDRIKKMLDDNMKNLRVEDCRIPFAAVATDVKTGDEIVIKKGKLADAVRASAALPVILHPAQFDGKLAADGGLSNPVPADVVRSMGAEFVVAVDVSHKWLKTEDDGSEDTRGVYAAIMNAIALAEYQLARPILKHADIVLRPPVWNFSIFGFSDAQEIISLGEEEARLRAKEIGKSAGIGMPPKTAGEKFLGFLFGNTDT